MNRKQLYRFNREVRSRNSATLASASANSNSNSAKQSSASSQNPMRAARRRRLRNEAKGTLGNPGRGVAGEPIARTLVAEVRTAAGDIRSSCLVPRIANYIEPNALAGCVPLFSVPMTE
jgi:hypothetical protein